MSHPNPHHDPENVRTDDHHLARTKAINNAIKGPIKRISHLGRKGAPGIEYKNLTPKEKHYRNEHGKREDVRLEKFRKTGYGRHLTERAHRRGEED